MALAVEHGSRRAGALGSAGELTPEWCTAALAGTAVAGGRVVDCQVTAIGTGQVADTFRLGLQWEPSGAGAPSYVAKVTAASPASRAAARATRSYEVEVGFYRDIAPGLDLSRPACHFAAYEPDGNRCTIVLEDLAPARTGDQLGGLAEADALRAVHELAALHSAHWGDGRAGTLEWMPRRDAGTANRMASLATTLQSRFLRRFGGRLLPEVADLVERFVPRVAQYLCERPGPRTVVHGDFRADNMLFDTRRVAVVDFQTVAHEHGAADLSYFLGGSLTTVERRRVERDVVELYAALLRRRGVELAAAAAWHEYRRYALDGLLMAIVASALVARTERGDEMFAVMANRHGVHALDVGALPLLDGRR